MNRDQWLQGLLFPHSRRREFLRRASAEGEPEKGLAGLLRALGSDSERRARISSLVAHCASSQIQIVTPAEALYPREWLEAMDDFPPALFVKGRAELLSRREAVSIVGARRATADGIVWAERCGRDLARSGCIVVSGLAHGIDAASHRGCLAAGGDAIAVLGTGVDRAYPPENAELQLEIQERGCVLSELPPGFGPRKWNFVARNRIIAGLGLGLVVVEAGRQSGTLSTVAFAQDFGRDVMVVPGFPGRPQHEGTLQLIRDGAGVVRDARDVMEDLGLAPLRSARAARLPGGLLGPASAEEIAQATGKCLRVTVAELSALEIEGQVRRIPGGLYMPPE
jgi:DNA processing protein